MWPIYYFPLFASRSSAVRFTNQLVERLCSGEHLIRAHAGAGERRHTADYRGAPGLRLEHHKIERVLAMAARAAGNQKAT
jgi:hypothetical protein